MNHPRHRHRHHHHHHHHHHSHQVKKFKTARFAAWLGGLDIKEELEKANVEFRTEFWLPQVMMVMMVTVVIVLVIICNDVKIC